MRNICAIEPQFVVLGDGLKVVSRARGDAVLPVVLHVLGGPPLVKPLVLSNSLLVPEMEMNLISCSSLCHDGYEINMSSSGCYVMKADDLVINSCVQQGL